MSRYFSDTTSNDQMPSRDEHPDLRRSRLPAPAGGVTPVFTLRSALRWLGHECPAARCSRLLDALPASIWFVLSDGSGPTFFHESRVVIDLPIDAPRGQMIAIISEINVCTRDDATVVGHLPLATSHLARKSNHT